jgi:hypothetical protein
VADSGFIVVDARGVQRALRQVSPELVKRTRRMMAAEARKVRDDARADWPGDPGPAAGGHSKVAVTSGTKGLTPTVSLRRDHPRFPQVGWVIFGGVRRRRYETGVRVDRRARAAPLEGYAFYPAVKRARQRVIRQADAIVAQAIREAGLG